MKAVDNTHHRFIVLRLRSTSSKRQIEKFSWNLVHEGNKRLRDHERLSLMAVTSDRRKINTLIELERGLS